MINGVSTDSIGPQVEAFFAVFVYFTVENRLEESSGAGTWKVTTQATYYYTRDI
jgi:hypothetical protein